MLDLNVDPPDINRMSAPSRLPGSCVEQRGQGQGACLHPCASSKQSGLGRRRRHGAADHRCRVPSLRHGLSIITPSTWATHCRPLLERQADLRSPLEQFRRAKTPPVVSTDPAAISFGVTSGGPWARLGGSANHWVFQIQLRTPSRSGQRTSHAPQPPNVEDRLAQRQLRPLAIGSSSQRPLPVAVSSCPSPGRLRSITAADLALKSWSSFDALRQRLQQPA